MRSVLVLFTVYFLLTACDPNRELPGTVGRVDADLSVSGSMRATMRDGQLQGTIDLDTLSDREGLYGLGPAEYLRGEVMVYDGEIYRSRVGEEETAMIVERTDKVRPPFFVHTRQRNWAEYNIPPNVRDLDDLVDYVGELRIGNEAPTVFRLTGKVASAQIHVQNLPEGVIPTSPREAHQGQRRYTFKNREVDVLGFFSTHHQGVFTHHDSYGHLHLITHERDMMGHLDELVVGEGMKLFMPE